MRLVYAMCSNVSLQEMAREHKPKNILASFIYSSVIFKFVDWPVDLMLLDSGAFSAWSLGKEINRTALAKWAIEVSKGYENISEILTVNLDVIPGLKGKTSTAKEREQAITDSIDNADFLRSCGLNVIEVYHQDEPKEYLDLLIDRLPENGVLGIGGRKDISGDKRIEWMIQVGAHICQKRGMEKFPKVHGFGVGADNQMYSFPFYSVDSSSWTIPQRYGRMYHPKRRFRSRSTEKTTLMSGVTHGLAPNRNWIRMQFSYFDQVEREVTDFWERQGITWK